MKVKVNPRRALMWGVMFVLAYVGGSRLGRFVVAGVDAHPRTEMAGFALPRASNASSHEAAATHAAAQQFRDSGLANHVCTGCDAGQTRYRQMAQQMGMPVGDTRGAGQAPADSEAASVE